MEQNARGSPGQLIKYPAERLEIGFCRPFSIGLRALSAVVGSLAADVEVEIDMDIDLRAVLFVRSHRVSQTHRGPTLHPDQFVCITKPKQEDIISLFLSLGRIEWRKSLVAESIQPIESHRQRLSNASIRIALRFYNRRRLDRDRLTEFEAWYDLRILAER